MTSKRKNTNRSENFTKENFCRNISGKLHAATFFKLRMVIWIVLLMLRIRLADNDACTDRRVFACMHSGERRRAISVVFLTRFEFHGTRVHTSWAL